MQSTTYLQVFEHQTLRIHPKGLTERHWRALAAFNEQHDNRYFTLVHRGVRFRQYVGVLQVGDLCLEILPKTDQHSTAQQWQRVLLQLLQCCDLLPQHTLSEACLRLQSSPLLVLYLDAFADAVQGLLHEGLLKQYQQQERLGTTWKGQVNFAQQLQSQWRHPQRVYSRQQVYDLAHPAHQVLYQALQVVHQAWLPPALRQKVGHLLRAFPSQKPCVVTDALIDQLVEQPTLRRYRRALEMARLILMQYSPDLRVGRHLVLALLFDMNQLFERYLQDQLQRYLDPSWTFRAQASKRFWANRRLRPDFWLERGDTRYVLDAKWKILKRPTPSDADLRQMFAYNHSFQTTQSVLLYPNVFALPPRCAAYTAPVTIGGQPHPHYCHVLFVDILTPEGTLNTNIAAQIMEQLRQAQPQARDGLSTSDLF